MLWWRSTRLSGTMYTVDVAEDIYRCTLEGHQQAHAPIYG